MHTEIGNPGIEWSASVSVHLCVEPSHDCIYALESGSHGQQHLAPYRPAHEASHRIECPKLGTMTFQHVEYGSGFRVPAPPEVEG